MRNRQHRDNYRTKCTLGAQVGADKPSRILDCHGTSNTTPDRGGKDDDDKREGQEESRSSHTANRWFLSGILMGGIYVDGIRLRLRLVEVFCRLRRHLES